MLVMSDRKSFAREGRKVVWTVSRSLSETRPPATRRMSEENVMTPSPPSWMRARMTDWPKPLNAVAVSTTTRPVTQTAEVDVNRASMKEMRPPRALTRKPEEHPPGQDGQEKAQGEDPGRLEEPMLSRSLNVQRRVGACQSPQIDRRGTVCYF